MGLGLTLSSMLVEHERRREDARKPGAARVGMCREAKNLRGCACPHTAWHLLGSSMSPRFSSRKRLGPKIVVVGAMRNGLELRTPD